MANTKGKILIGTGIVLVGGAIALIITKSVRKKNIEDRIYKSLDDLKSSEGLGATLSEEEKHKANFGFDPNFWKNGKNGVIPDKKYLIPSMFAREKAKNIHDAIGFTDDEDKIMNEIKKIHSQGELSQVTDAYGSGTLSYGNLGDDLQTALKGTWYGSQDRLKDLNNYINSLPY